MIRRPVVLVLATVVVLLVAAPLGAAPSGEPGVLQELHLPYMRFSPGGGYVNGNLYFTSETGADLAGPRPSASYSAAGYVESYDDATGIWGWINFPPQAVSPTALTSDPLGNSVFVDVTLLDSGGVSHTYELSLTRPQRTFLSTPNEGSPGVNVWADPAGGQVGAGANERVGIRRYQYAVDGNMDGEAWSSPASGPCGTPCQSANPASFFGLDPTASVVLP